MTAPHLVVLVGASARFEKGKLVERPDDSGGLSKSHDTPIQASTIPPGELVDKAKRGNVHLKTVHLFKVEHRNRSPA